ncbi:GNAT family N-acetyltransferase [Marispirochaeta aestuarii]|uniref:GNAT family N-acetyltransferase n=1 Tax=Marispirochaeta aestuarii TaxID=1963862 RepID=UPI0029C770BB|nr:GNAT family N-acetyltransferase [Marispirochaeta aestuarii]
MVRILTQIDLPQAQDLFRTVIDDLISRGIDQWDEVYPALSDITDDLQKGCGFGYFRENTLAGYVALNDEYDPEYKTGSWKYTEGRPLYFHRLAVRPAFQGQGIAGSLIRFAEKHARKMGYSAIRLDAFPPNTAALSMYERRGYSRAGYVTFRKGRFVLLEKALYST